MKIISEYTVKTTQVETDNHTLYTRQETSEGTILWIDVDVIFAECRNNKWQERFKCSLRDCPAPVVELEYQRLLC